MGGGVMDNVGPRKRRRRMWGTWEELVLGGAVLRHGTRDWNVVASELRARILYPYGFSPEVCKAKYEDLRRRYSGCTAWFEELRKRRVAELKRELAKSEDSIGSLELKLESLKAEKRDCNQIGYGSSHTESHLPLPKMEAVETSGKEASKDGLSAGSFTQDFRTSWSSDFQIPALESAPEMEQTPVLPGACDLERVVSVDKLAETSNEQGKTLRKRRGKRKRKDCLWDAKEGSFGESDNLGSTDIAECNETSTSRCQTVRSSSIDFLDGDSCREGSDDLVGIFNSILENEIALVFRHRLDSQKRARYRKTIRQHMDLDTIRSRIATCSIKSAKELFRDLLLLANNALVFYSKRTREYKSALLLRDIVMSRYRQHFNHSCNRGSSSILYFSPMYNPPVRPRSIRSRPSKLITVPAKPPSISRGPRGYLKVSNSDSSPSHLSGVMGKRNDGDLGVKKLQSPVKAKKCNVLPQGYGKVWNDSDPNLPAQPPVVAKKGVGRPRKIGGEKGSRQSKTLVPKERKRARQK